MERLSGEFGLHHASRGRRTGPLRRLETHENVEDYEITGADTGIVTVGYSGSCTVCKLSLDFTETHPIPGA